MALSICDLDTNEGEGEEGDSKDGGYWVTMYTHDSNLVRSTVDKKMRTVRYSA